MDSSLSLSITEVFLGTLSSHIGDEWEMLGTHLNFRRDQIDRLKRDYINTEDRILNMLVTWRRIQPRDRDLKRVLVNALRKSGRSDLAHNLHRIELLHTENLPLPQGLDEVILRTLSSHIGDEWERLGKSLYLRQDQLERLKQDFTKTDDRVFSMLVLWRRNQNLDKDLKAVLEEALIRNGRRDLAAQFLHSPVTNASTTDGEITSSPSTRTTDGVASSSSTRTGETASSSSTRTFTVKICQKELMTFYEQTMGAVQLLPWGHEVVDMDTIFVNLTLALDGKFSLESAGKTIKTPDELLVLKGRNGKRVNRVLVKGFAGSGKSTIMAKLAYDWTKLCHSYTTNDAQGHSLSCYSLLFLLSLREVDVQKSLTDAIFDQILPEDTAVSRQGLEAYLESYGKDVLVLLDGLDESTMQKMPQQVVGDTESILANRKMRDTCVVVTTRPYKVEDLGDHQKHYAQVKLTGFSEDNIEVYVRKFFQGNKLAIEGLIGEIRKSPSIKTLAQIPVMLLMLCLLWSDVQQLPDTYTSLYEQAILYLWRRYQNDDISKTDKDIEMILKTLGKVALDGVISEGKLVFLDNEFPDQILKEACQAGLLTKERLRSKLKINTAVSFLHKSIQEYCAAYFWVTLTEKDDSSFQSYLQHISNDDQVFAQVEILSFCCGMSEKAAAIILPHVVQILKHRAEDSLRIGGITQTARKDIWPIFRMLHESQLKYEAVRAWLEPLFQSKIVEIRQNPPASLRYFHNLVMNTTKSNKESVLSQICEVKLFCGSESIGLIVETLHEMTQVESLVLSWETEAAKARPNQSKIVALSDSVSRLSRLKDITILAKYKFDISSIICGLVRGCNSNLRKIELGNVEFDTQKMGYALEVQINLESLLMTNVTLTSQGAAKMLSQIRAPLKVIHMVSSLIGEAVQHLRPLMPSLQELIMRETQLEEDNIGVLADLLPMAGQLRHLDLSWNNIGRSMLKLASKLKHCRRIDNLTLVNCNLAQEGAIALIDTCQFLPRLMSLVLSLGSHRSASAAAVAPRNNGFVIAEAILRSLPLLPNLSVLHIKHLEIPKHDAPSDMVVTCLSAIDFYWPGVLEDQAIKKSAHFGLWLGSNRLAKLKTAVNQYIEENEALDQN